MDDLCDSIQPLEAQIIRLRFCDGMKIKQAAAHAGMTWVKAQHLERKALRKFRHPSWRSKLDAVDCKALKLAVQAEAKRVAAS